MKKKIKDNITNDELKKLKYIDIVRGRPFVETFEVIIYLVMVIYAFYIGFKILSEENNIFLPSYSTLLWQINYLLTAIFSWRKWKQIISGDPWVQLNIRFTFSLWLSFIYLYYNNLNPLHFYYTAPLILFGMYQLSYQLDKRFIKKYKINNKIDMQPEVLAKNTGYFFYLLFFILFFITHYYLQEFLSNFSF